MLASSIQYADLFRTSCQEFEPALQLGVVKTEHTTPLFVTAFDFDVILDGAVLLLQRFCAQRNTCCPFEPRRGGRTVSAAEVSDGAARCSGY